jgi:hypothetical protein
VYESERKIEKSKKEGHIEGRKIEKVRKRNTLREK